MPRLREGDLVVWDHHPVHKRPALRETIRARGADVVCQPRYSPEFNACGGTWPKAEHWARRARADTEPSLSGALSSAVEALTEEDSAGWLRHAGCRAGPTA